MDRSKKQVSSSSSSPPSSNLDHLFGPKNSSPSASASASGTGLFGTIFPPPSKVLGRRQEFASQVGDGKFYTADDMINGSSRSESKEYQINEVTEPSYFSSSIHYGGQENYSPRTRVNHEHPPVFKKDGGDYDDANGGSSNSVSRGNWWQGSLYY